MFWEPLLQKNNQSIKIVYLTTSSTASWQSMNQLNSHDVVQNSSIPGGYSLL